MATDARKHNAPAAGETPRRQAINDLSLTVNDIVPVENATERAQLLADLTALGYAPSGSRPLYVHRNAAPSTIGRLESTVDGTTWLTHFAEVGRGYEADSAGGGSLTTSWAVSSSPASVALPAGKYLVAASLNFILSPSAAVNVEAHLFDSTGAAFGSAMGSNRNVPAGGTQSFTAEFTRTITVAAGGQTLQIRRRTSAVGGTQSSGTEHLHVVRIA